MNTKTDVREEVITKIMDQIKTGHWSPKFCHILGCMFKLPSKIEELYITIDGGLLARPVGSIGYDWFIGDKQDLINNLIRISKDANMTDEEYKYLLSLPGIQGEGVRNNGSH